MGQNKTILITGGAGFIGSNYLNKFVPLHPDWLFVNIDALTYAGRLENIQVSKAGNYVFVKIDIRDQTKLEEIFQHYKPTGLIHFAAESHVDLSLTNPHLFVETNVCGTHNLLLLAKKYNLERFLQISTDEVYGALGPADQPFSEQSPLAPNNPYSASKAGAECLARAYYRTYGLEVVITRSSNNYGPNQDTSKLIPRFITKLLHSEKVPLYGQGENVRDWLYVEDNIDAIDLVFQKGRAGEIYNIGGGCELKNIEIVKKLLALSGRGEEMIDYVSDRLGHDFRYALDATKIKNELGWQPQKTLTDGLAKTFASYQQADPQN